MNFMTAKRKKVIWISIGALLFLIFVAPFLLIFGSNAVAGIASLIFERRPSVDELAGTYKYAAVWGTATLKVNQNGTFEETIFEKSGQQEQFVGTWNSRDELNSVELDFRPFGMVWDEDHGRETNVYGLSFFKRRFGGTYANINDDLGEQFDRQ